MTALRGGSAPPLVAVAHGSRDPRSASTVAALVEVVRRLRPGLDVRLAYLERSAPRLPEVLAGLRDDGHPRAVVVPLLLGCAYHAGVDLPAAVSRARRQHPELELRVAAVLGPDPRLAALALRRLAEAGAAVDGPCPARAGPGGTGLGVVLAGAGSSDLGANAAVAGVAARWAAHRRWVGAVAAFAAAAEPTVPAAVIRLRAAGASRVAVASWFLAPGLLPDRVHAAALAADPAAVLADPLGADPAVAEVLLDRYDERRGVQPGGATSPSLVSTGCRSVTIPLSDRRRGPRGRSPWLPAGPRRPRR